MTDQPILRFADGSERTVYTAEYVAVRLKEAAATLRLIPHTNRDKPGGLKSHLPEPVRDYWEVLNSLHPDDRDEWLEEQNETKPRPTARRIDRMWEAVMWMYLIEWARDRNVVWAMACGGSLRKIAKVDGRSHQQIKNIWDRTTDLIAAHLNAELIASISPCVVFGSARTAVV